LLQRSKPRNRGFEARELAADVDDLRVVVGQFGAAIAAPQLQLRQPYIGPLFLLALFAKFIRNREPKGAAIDGRKADSGSLRQCQSSGCCTAWRADVMAHARGSKFVGLISRSIVGGKTYKILVAHSSRRRRIDRTMTLPQFVHFPCSAPRMNLALGPEPILVFYDQRRDEAAFDSGMGSTMKKNNRKNDRISEREYHHRVESLLKSGFNTELQLLRSLKTATKMRRALKKKVAKDSGFTKSSSTASG
jgi:hypothetical protein